MQLSQQHLAMVLKEDVRGRYRSGCLDRFHYLALFKSGEVGCDEGHRLARTDVFHEAYRRARAQVERRDAENAAARKSVRVEFPLGGFPLKHQLVFDAVLVRPQRVATHIGDCTGEVVVACDVVIVDIVCVAAAVVCGLCHRVQ